MKLIRVSLTTLAMFVAIETPASAATTPAAAKPWHYWIAPVLAASFVLMALALALGYFVKVLNPRHGLIRFGRR